MIKNRAVALTVILLIYILAGFCGIFAYNYFSAQEGFNLSYPFALLFADISATVLVFIFSLIFKNASVYDPYWSVQPPVILAIALDKMKGGGNNLLAWLLFAAVLFWALRLTANWAYNFKSFEYQDWRYVMLKEKSGRLYPLVNFFGIHLFPTIVVYLCVLPAVSAIYNKADLNPLSIIFIGLSFCAVVLQGLADIQMHIFRNSEVSGFNRIGLWKHGRHPNYACEILMWWGIGLASVISLGDSYWLLAGALINTLMFFFISIPMADKRQSRKPGFGEYKKETRLFF